MIASPRSRSRVMHHEDIGTSGYRCLIDPSVIDTPLPLTLDAYCSILHVLISYSGRMGAVDGALTAIGRERRVLVALTQFAALPSFLIGAPVVATLPSHAALALCRATTLQTFDPPMAMGSYPVSLAWRRDRDADPANRWMRNLMRTTWQAIVPEQEAHTQLR